MRCNFIGPVAFTNALIPYLKPMPQKEEEKKEKEAGKVEKSEAKEEKAEEPVEVTDTKKAEEKAKEEVVEEAKAETVLAVVEKPLLAETKPDAQEPTATASTTEATTSEKQEVATSEAPVEKPTEAAPAAEGESTEPVPPVVPSVLPAQPFVVFLAPSDPIQNLEGAVSTGSSFSPSPRTLFSLSRASLQVAIAKYALGLGSKGIGIVGMERHGHRDPVSTDYG